VTFPRVARRDAAGLVVALVVAAGCVRLGFWQLHRLHQRRARNAALGVARQRPAVEVTGALAADSARDRRLHARGVFDYARERLWRARTYEGVPGVALITPLRLPDGVAVFVDRGWAASPDAFHVDDLAYREGDSAEVLGIGMRAPRARGDVDPASLGDSVPYRLLAFVIQELPAAAGSATAPSPSTPPDRASRRGSPPPPERLRVAPLRWPLPVLDDGPHLSYAIQWFSFAVIIVVGSVALARQRVAARG
jgi:surfeit locus 1 family protein